MSYRDLPSEWTIPRGKFLMIIAVIVPLVMLGTGVAMFQERGARLVEMVPVLGIMLGLLVFMFAFLGRMAHRIERSSDTLTFIGLTVRREMRMKDIQRIRCMSSTKGLHTANQNFNFLEVFDDEGKVRLAGLFTGFVDLVIAIREENPNLTLEGL